MEGLNGDKSGMKIINAMFNLGGGKQSGQKKKELGRVIWKGGVYIFLIL